MRMPYFEHGQAMFEHDIYERQYISIYYKTSGRRGSTPRDRVRRVGRNARVTRTCGAQMNKARLGPSM